MATKADTKVYAPGSKKMTLKLPGSVPRDEAVKAAREALKEQLTTIEQILRSPDPWGVKYSATGPASEVVLDGGSVTFTPDIED